MNISMRFEIGSHDVDAAVVVVSQFLAEFFEHACACTILQSVKSSFRL